jgi:hypothetical protein
MEIENEVHGEGALYRALHMLLGERMKGEVPVVEFVLNVMKYIAASEIPVHRKIELQQGIAKAVAGEIGTWLG